MKRVAVILSGCGVYDGTEVHEASAVMVHLSRAGAKVMHTNKATPSNSLEKEHSGNKQNT